MTKQDFIKRLQEVGTPQIIVVAIKLPTGAIEVITNTQETESKAKYYIDNYDNDLKLKHNENVQIIGYMFV